jgi:hypothetical protein
VSATRIAIAVAFSAGTLTAWGIQIRACWRLAQRETASWSLFGSWRWIETFLRASYVVPWRYSLMRPSSWHSDDPDVVALRRWAIRGLVLWLVAAFAWIG